MEATVLCLCRSGPACGELVEGRFCAIFRRVAGAPVWKTFVPRGTFHGRLFVIGCWLLVAGWSLRSRMFHVEHSFSGCHHRRESAYYPNRQDSRVQKCSTWNTRPTDRQGNNQQPATSNKQPPLKCSTWNTRPPQSTGGTTGNQQPITNNRIQNVPRGTLSA